MLIFLLPAITLLSPPPPSQAKAAEAVVVLEDRSIALPPLPQAGQQGRRRFKEVHLQIQTAQETLKDSTQRLQATPEANFPLTDRLELPRSLAPEARELMDILVDPEFTRLEQAYLDAWKGWQAALKEGGLTLPEAARTRGLEPKSERFEEARQRGLRTLQSLPSLNRRVEQDSDRLHTSFQNEDMDTGAEIDKGLLPEQQRVLKRLNNYVAMAQKTLRVANVMIPNLGESWTPLVLHLNSQAQRLLNLEQMGAPTPNETLNALRTRTKIAYLKRFQAALWYCDLVWCQTALAEPPPPPQRIP